MGTILFSSKGTVHFRKETRRNDNMILMKGKPVRKRKDKNKARGIVSQN